MKKRINYWLDEEETTDEIDIDILSEIGIEIE